MQFIDTVMYNVVSCVSSWSVHDRESETLELPFSADGAGSDYCSLPVGLGNLYIERMEMVKVDMETYFYEEGKEGHKEERMHENTNKSVLLLSSCVIIL